MSAQDCVSNGIPHTMVDQRGNCLRCGVSIAPARLERTPTRVLPDGTHVFESYNVMQFARSFYVNQPSHTPR